MSDPTSHPAFDGRLAHGQKVAQFAFLWILASLATALGILGLVYVVSLDNDRAAGRLLGDVGQGKGYVATIVSALAASQARPRRY